MRTFSFSARRGDTYNGVQFQYIINEVPKNLTGATIKIGFRQGSANGQQVLVLSTGNGVTITNAAQGIFRIDPFIVLLPAGNYPYDIQLTDVAGVVKTYVSGTLKVIQDITV